MHRSSAATQQRYAVANAFNQRDSNLSHQKFNTRETDTHYRNSHPQNNKHNQYNGPNRSSRYTQNTKHNQHNGKLQNMQQSQNQCNQFNHHAPTNEHCRNGNLLLSMLNDNSDKNNKNDKNDVDPNPNVIMPETTKCDSQDNSIDNHGFQRRLPLFNEPCIEFDELPAFKVDEKFERGLTCRMFFAQIHSPYKFWFQLDEYAEKIDRLMDKMEYVSNPTIF